MKILCKNSASHRGLRLKACSHPFTYARERPYAKNCHCEECNDEAISSGGAWEIATGCRPRNDMLPKLSPLRK
jgi:hypothetical protein